ncbi:helix-turn-helix transcriptional regulator [Streptomyces sp. RFCAC02]|uniref:helix-turn-helix domain-containing protein n=1 Tax=Streptomyces sp. RFCAC02 TaxID=2499143 RepID=UPI001F0FFF83|nr:helix-turn-helix transcriptional regulator [Streptomyces sp. RFCAC02]
MSTPAHRPVRTLPLPPAAEPAKEPLWRDVVGGVLRRERLAQDRTLKDVAEAARISMPYLSEIERGLKEASSEVLAAAARALGLGLAELLALVHRDLIRLTAVRRDDRRAATAAAPVTPVTSITALAARRPGPRASAAGPGEVRLAA